VYGSIEAASETLCSSPGVTRLAWLFVCRSAASIHFTSAVGPHDAGKLAVQKIENQLFERLTALIATA